MAKKKELELPATPTFQRDQNYQQGINQLQGLGQKLTNFDFSGNLSPLADTINLDPEITKLALQFAQQSLTPAWNQNVTNIRNEAANAGALESSTFTDALSQAGADLQSQFQAITTGAALDDRSRAMSNRIGLFGTGTGLLESSASMGLQNQGQTNQFNLANYDNQVAKSIQDNQNANRLKPWQQALSFASPVAHDYYNSQGMNGVPGYGVADFASMASMFVPGGGSGGGLTGGARPGATAGALTQEDRYKRLLAGL